MSLDSCEIILTYKIAFVQKEIRHLSLSNTKLGSRGGGVCVMGGYLSITI